MYRRARNLVGGLLALLLLATPAAAQTSADDLAARTADTLYRLAHLFAPPQQSITIPNTFVNGTVADATQVNANFTALSSNAVNRNGGTMIGTLNSRAVTPTSDATYDVGTNVLRFRDGWFSRNGSFAGTLGVTGMATFGASASFTGAVTLSGGLNTPLVVAQGGTGLGAGTSGGVLGYTATGTLASSALLPAHGVVVGAGAGATPVGTAAGSAGQVLGWTSGTTDPAPVGGMTLLHTASGTTTSAVAVNVDTFAFTGTLTALDTLHIVVAISEATQPTGNVSIYSNTDTTNILLLGAINAGQTLMAIADVTPDQSAATQYNGVLFCKFSGGDCSVGTFTTGLTAWTGTWTIALRTAGVTAGGTLRYKWAIYKDAGQ